MGNQNSRFRPPGVSPAQNKGSNRLIPWRVIAACLMVLVMSSASLQPHKLQSIMQDRYGDEGLLILNAWQHLLSETSSSPEDVQLEQVNQFFNQRLQFTDDRLLWQQADYWATPLQTMGMRGGDCEDFVIAKYISLLKLGIPPEKLRLIYVRARMPVTDHIQAHMVLGYYSTPDAIPVILDNLQPAIVPASERTDLSPVFSFNSEGLWIGGSATTSSPTTRLSRWRDVLQRMQEEGLAP